jgi:hypothetical protein
MATKAQAIAALKKHSPNATLIDESNPDYWVQLEAPKGHHWSGDVHCRSLFWYDTSNKSEFWDMVIDEIKTCLPESCPCEEDDCEGIVNWGTCEYWED